MSIHALDKNMYIENVVIDYRDRPTGSMSKLNTYTDGVKVLYTIARLYKNYKPFAFFGIIALLLTALAAGFFVPVLSVYLRTGQVPNFPTLIVCGFTFIAALLSFFSGLQLENSVQKNKQDFEINLMRIYHDMPEKEKEQ